ALVEDVGDGDECQLLQQNASRAGEQGVEQALAAKQRGLDLADVLNVVADRRLQRDQTPGVDTQGLSGREIEWMHRAAGVDEAQAITLEALHDEAFAAEQA